jgi:carbonic anhydrase
MKGSTELPKSHLSRRKFLGSALAGTAATLAGTAAMSFFSTAPAFAQSNLTPDEALKELLDGNQRYIAGRFTSFDEDKQILRDRTVEKQQPSLPSSPVPTPACP